MRHCEDANSTEDGIYIRHIVQGLLLARQLNIAVYFLSSQSQQV